MMWVWKLGSSLVDRYSANSSESREQKVCIQTQRHLMWSWGLSRIPNCRWYRTDMLRQKWLLKSQPIYMFAHRNRSRKSYYGIVSIRARRGDNYGVRRTASHSSLLCQQTELDLPARGAASRCITRSRHSNWTN